MSTTNLFVELIIIGIGTLAWLIIAIIAAFGYSWLPIDNVSIYLSALPTLAFVYVLGIIWDRFADSVFDFLWNDELKEEHYSSNAKYYNTRRNILTESKEFYQMFQYARSRMRICRGWTLNALGIAICLSFPLFLETNFRAQPRVLISGIVGFSILSVCCWFAWNKLTKEEYRKLEEQSKFLEQSEQ